VCVCVCVCLSTLNIAEGTVLYHCPVCQCNATFTVIKNIAKRSQAHTVRDVNSSRVKKKI